jgi:hypothetical protein
MSIAKSTRNGLLALAAALLCLAAFAAPGADAAFGIADTELAFEDAGGSPVTQAGSHPFAMSTTVNFETILDEEGKIAPDEATKDLITELPEGFAGVPTATPRCSSAQFAQLITGIDGGHAPPLPGCPNSSAVGIIRIRGDFTPVLPEDLAEVTIPVYNLLPGPGTLAKFGFLFAGVPVLFDVGLSEEPPYRAIASFHNTAQSILVYGATVTIWGDPLADIHDAVRGLCLFTEADDLCEVDGEGEPLITMPTSCAADPRADFEGNSWQHPGAWARAFAVAEAGLSECAALDFAPSIGAAPTSKAASSPSGLDFGLTMQNPGFLDPDGIASSTIERTEVTLPAGFTVNPSVAAGLEVCTEAQLRRESAFSAPGEGCPDASKLGTVEVESPAVEETVRGSLYQAAPYQNPFDSLIALYVVLKSPQLGVKVIQPLKVVPDPKTGRLTTIAEDMPQLPFTSFRLRFREGARSPLITPPGCGSFEVEARLHPSSGGPAAEARSSFELIAGPNGGDPCPSGPAPFAPGFEAGTDSNRAGSYSPFFMRLTRRDGEQDLTRFDSVLAPGVLARIAGIPYCPEAGIARAKSRTGEHGGIRELNDPSCPLGSRIGRTLAGAGVGSQLVHVPGSLYLAGPFHGNPLSVVAITPALAGPFDAGAVVVRQALTLNPVTGEVEVDGAASDPIPHILQGIPLNVRDLRVYVDRPGFTLNATSCEEGQVRATLFGGGTVLAPGPDSPVALSSRYQAADCAALGFKPRLAIKLRGGVKRGAHPALRAVVSPRPGDANFSRALVKLPRSAFLDQAHIRTICTRVQFAAGPGSGAGCPAASIYGEARAWSPLLAEPLEGPVYLRSSEHNLPDLVIALHGLVEIELAARIDSVRGGIRSTFTGIPDAAVSRFILDMRGGRKGLIVNSRHLCRRPGRNRARSNLTGQNGKRHNTRPAVKAKCGKKGSKKRHRRVR